MNTKNAKQKIIGLRLRFNKCYICKRLNQKPKNFFKFGFDLPLGRCWDHEDIHFCVKCNTINKITGQLICFSCMEKL